MIDWKNVKRFVDAWKDRGGERADAQSFWLDLIGALGIERPSNFIRFELPIDVDNHKCFIDGWIPSTRVLIEQKGRGIDLDKPARQSDEKMFTPFEQALRYADALPYSQRPRWIVTCNFDELRIYDMDRFHREDSYAPNSIPIERLPSEYSRLNFLIDPDDENVDPAVKISKQAGELVGLLYNSFGDVDPVELNKLCVRLVFCLYADDAFIFPQNIFRAYLDRFEPEELSRELAELFSILDTPSEAREPNLDPLLKNFPYVNGSLFADKVYRLPQFGREAKYWLSKSKEEFDWSGISPTIFGALFESTLNPDLRSTGGMHYTSIENIHKLIDPLFLDELHEEFQSIRRKRKNKQRELEKFQCRLARLTFLDPACGSGNFLTETFLSLRRLENEVIRELYALGEQCSILVSIENFFGIEINDFAVAVARTALWIAENQMLRETEMIIHDEINFLPLTSAANIVEGNALRLDWHELAPRGVDFIIGNPPFLGYSFQSDAQKNDLIESTGIKNKKLDYVVGWFHKAAEFMRGSETRAAFVATNSICQGEQVGAVWKKLFETIRIDFAHRPFKWISESEDMAAVHCVIVGFSIKSDDDDERKKFIFDGKRKFEAKHINAYLLDAPDFFVEPRREPLCNVPRMGVGNRPSDGGSLIIKASALEEFLRLEPRAEKFIRPLIGAEEFINGKERYCLWLVDATADDLKLPLIKERVEACRRKRLKSPDAGARKLAATPHLFREQINPPHMIVVPSVSSERRKYIPIGFVDDKVIATNLVLIIPDGDLFHFGVLESSVHMAWTEIVCGRLEMRYRYSAFVVYNNFPWIERSASIERTAQKILDARSLYPSRSLAELYDPNTMPPELKVAHAENDRAVLAAYGFDENLSELEIVTRLMKMYQALSN